MSNREPPSTARVILWIAVGIFLLLSALVYASNEISWLQPLEEFFSKTLPPWLYAILYSIGTLAGIVLGFVLLIGLMALTGTEPDCFVATAVYGSKNHLDVVTFQRFRDRVLLKNFFGKAAVFLYYRIGPYLAKLAICNPVFRDYSYRKLSKLAKWLRAKYKDL